MSDPAPPLPRAVVLSLAVLTVVVVGALSLVLFWGDIVTDEDDLADATVAEPAGDDFERADADGLAADGADWTEPLGTWAIQDGHAALTAGADGPLAGLAVLPAEAPSHLEVTATAVEPGWGVAFRVQDADDLWAVVARPERGSWSLVHVRAGAIEETPDFVAVEPTDLSVVQIDLVADLVRVSIDGGEPNEVSDPALAEAGDVGLLALPGGSLASMAWDDLTVAGG